MARALVQTQALFGKKAAPAKASPAKKGAAPKKASGTVKKSGGWLGSNSGNINLDKASWVGRWRSRLPARAVSSPGRACEAP